MRLAADPFRICLTPVVAPHKIPPAYPPMATPTGRLHFFEQARAAGRSGIDRDASESTMNGTHPAGMPLHF